MFHNFNYGQHHTQHYICHKGQYWQHVNEYFCVNLVELKKTALKTLYPQVVSRKLCMIMLLTNLAEVEWINIHCSEKLLQHIVCGSRPKLSPSSLSQSTVNREAIMSSKMCLNHQISKDVLCFEFKWTKPNMSANSQIFISACVLNTNRSAAKYTSFQQVQFIFDTTLSVFHPTLFAHNCTHVGKLTFQKILNFNKYKTIYFNI